MGVGMPSIGPVVTSSDRIRPLKPLSAFMVSHGLPLRSPLECIRLARQQIAQALPGLVRKVNVTIATGSYHLASPSPAAPLAAGSS